MNFSDAEDAFLFVGGAPPFEHTAMVNIRTGQVCLQSEVGGWSEIPDEAYDSDSWRAIPHKNDLGLGSDLVFAFAVESIPADLDRVESIFNRKGAYSRFKDLLEKRGVLEKWYEFEDASLKEAILQWCHDEGIQISE